MFWHKYCHKSSYNEVEFKISVPKDIQILSDATLSGLEWRWINSDESVLSISQSFRTGNSRSDCLVSYPGHSYASADTQSVFSTAPANWKTFPKVRK